MNAMLQQISPQDALRNFEDIAAASSEMISTNVPDCEVDTFLDLAIKAKSARRSGPSPSCPGVVTGDPDIDVVHAMVADAIDRAEGEAAPDKKRKKNPDAVTGGSVGSLSEGYAANQADADLAAAC